MIALKSSQAETLFHIVKFANENGGLLPTGVELARVLGLSTRAASARMHRLLLIVDCKKKGNGRYHYIDSNKLITEKRSALFCVALSNLIDSTSSKVISLAEIIGKIGADYENLPLFLDKLCEAEYLIKPLEGRKEFRKGKNLIFHDPYLRLLSQN